MPPDWDSTWLPGAERSARTTTNRGSRATTRASVAWFRHHPSLVPAVIRVRLSTGTNVLCRLALARPANEYGGPRCKMILCLPTRKSGISSGGARCCSTSTTPSHDGLVRNTTSRCKPCITVPLIRRCSPKKLVPAAHFGVESADAGLDASGPFLIGFILFVIEINLRGMRCQAMVLGGLLRVPCHSPKRSFAPSIEEECRLSLRWRRSGL